MHAWRGRLAALWLGLVAAGCSSAGGADSDPGGGAGGAAANAGAGASQAGGGAPGSKTRVLARGEALDEALSFAFIAGYHRDEQLYLRGAGGALRRVSTWDLPAAYGSDCSVGWSTAGYMQGTGRFTRLQFTSDGAGLVFGERLACPESGRMRVLLHEPANGTTTVLTELPSWPVIAGAAGMTLVLSRRDEDGATHPADPDDVDAFELVDGALDRIAFARGEPWVTAPFYQGGVLMARWQQRVLLLVDGLVAHERSVGARDFEPSSLFAELGSDEISRLRESPSGTRLCAVTEAGQAMGEPGQRGWVLTPAGRWLPTPMLENSYGRCEFSPDESRVLFGTHIYELRGDALFEIASDAVPPGSAPWRSDLYGHDEHGFARIAWTTLARETMLPTDALPALCGPRPAGTTAASVQLHVPPDARPLAIGKVSCGCIDCDASGSFAWHVDSARVETVETPWGEHDVYGVAWLPDGGAVVATTQSRGTAAGGQREMQPSAGSYLRVHADGAVETIGPLLGVSGAIHSVASFPASPASSASWY